MQISRSKSDLGWFLKELRRYPMLDQPTEQTLARAWRDRRDPDAGERLAGSHLRLVVKIAKAHVGYGLPLADMIAAGNVGLMQALDRFDPDRGFRLSTYAMWWIRAAIQEYVLHAWSLVKIGTTAEQKKLFFNLRWLKAHHRQTGEGDLPQETVREIARALGVPEQEVVEMNRRLSGPDQSLNATLGAESDDEWQDILVDETADHETSIIESDALAARRRQMERALARLNPRERAILRARRLREEPKTLGELSEEFGISRERVRQIEVRAFSKLRAAMLEEERHPPALVAAH
ncbi:MAG: RNA polymerase sigma factor RpoH [Alphaproteobacteria bacterium]|nr:RNA polymerase sigma factor RpoH [Alphaproteobacteria bacterium]